MPYSSDWANRARQCFSACLIIFTVTGFIGCQTTTPTTSMTPTTDDAPRGFSLTQVALFQREGFVPTTNGWVLGLPDKALFDPGKSNLRQEGINDVTRLGHTLASAGIFHLRVYGYTDSVGSDPYNDALSGRRAMEIGRVLGAAGIDRRYIETRGLGKRYPIATNATAAGRARNRRVVIVVNTD